MLRKAKSPRRISFLEAHCWETSSSSKWTCTWLGKGWGCDWARRSLRFWALTRVASFTEDAEDCGAKLCYNGTASQDWRGWRQINFFWDFFRNVKTHAIVPRLSSQLIDNELLASRAVLRRASMDSWVEFLSVSKKIQWAAVEKDELAECIDEYHKANNTTGTVIAPFQQASLSRAPLSWIQRILTLLGVRPILAFFWASRGWSRQSIDAQRQSAALESFSSATAQ